MQGIQLVISRIRNVKFEIVMKLVFRANLVVVKFITSLVAKAKIPKLNEPLSEIVLKHSTIRNPVR